MPNLPEKLPPHSLDAERAVLGALVYERERSVETLANVAAVFKGRRPEVFYDLRHQAVFSAICDVGAEGAAFDALGVAEKLKDRKQFEEIGGYAFLGELSSATTGPAGAEDAARIVFTKFLLRRGIALASQFIADAYNEPEDPASLFDAFERDVLSLGTDRVGEEHIVDAKTLMRRVIDSLEEYHRGKAQLRGLPTGYVYLDNLLRGLAPGQVIVIGARPGMGKTSFGMNIVEYIAADCRCPALVISVEMTSDELGFRLPFQRTGRDYQRCVTGFMESRDFVDITNALPALSKAPLWICDQGGISIEAVRVLARRFKIQKGIKVVMVDYAQLMTTTKDCRSREEEVSHISRQLKAMAKELQVPVIVLAQLNRELERGKGRKPELSDLRESGAIEQDADVVGLLYQVGDDTPDPAADATERDWSKRFRRVNLRIAKQRNGPTGDVTFVFEKAPMRFLPWNDHTQSYSTRRRVGDEYLAEMKAAQEEEEKLAAQASANDGQAQYERPTAENLPSNEELGLE